MPARNLRRYLLHILVRRRLWIVIVLILGYWSLSWMRAPSEDDNFEKSFRQVKPLEPAIRNIQKPRDLPLQPDNDFEFRGAKVYKKNKPDFVPKKDKPDFVPKTEYIAPERKENAKENAPKESITNQKEPVTARAFLQDFEDSGQMVNPHMFHYAIINNHICQNTEVFLLILVHSAPNHDHERNLIRKTWGSVKSYKNQNIKVVFLLAKPQVTSIQNNIRTESDLFQDIVQEDFIDHYRNLTYKHLMGYKFVLTYCRHAKFVAKVDDDTFINIFRLVRFLMKTYSTDGTDDLLYCSVFRNIGPRRDKTDKWYVSHKEYRDDMYPPWCEGFAYVISPDLIQKLYQVSLFTKYYWIDDVYVTGILVKKLGVEHVQFRDPNGYAIMNDVYASPKVNDIIFLLAKYIRMHDSWADIWHAAVKYSQLGLPEHKGIQIKRPDQQQNLNMHQRPVRNDRPHDTIL